MILIDTWLVSGFFSRRRLCRFFFMMFWLPFLITGLLYCYRRETPLFHSNYYQPVPSQGQSGWWAGPGGIWPSFLALFPSNNGGGAALGGSKECCMSDHQLFERVKLILPALLRTVDQGAEGKDEELWADIKAKHEGDLRQLRLDLQSYISKEVEARGGTEPPSKSIADDGRVDLLRRKQDQHDATLTGLQAAIAAVKAESKGLSDKLQSSLGQIHVHGKEQDQSMLLMVKSLEEQLAGLQRSLDQLQEQQKTQEEHIGLLYKNDTILSNIIKSEVNQHFSTLLGGSARTDVPSLHQRFPTKEELDKQMADLSVALHQMVREESQAAAIAATAAGGAGAGFTAGSTYCASCDGEVGEQEVRMLIKKALATYDSDKTGMVDYALETAGGSVINTRCTETYNKHTAQLSLFGIPLWYASNSPRTVIQPGVHPGQCWPFKGTQGFMVIQLAGVVRVNGVTMEHMPRSLSPSGKIESAPRDFSVLGLESESDTEGTVLGNFTYDANADALQYFPIFKPLVKGFHLVELQIQSNWGKPEYTCLYRFRVHGSVVKYGDGR